MLSVLVAVHNSSQWLPQCLDSLRYNTYKDIEVIAVDDCSTDNSLQILNSYAAADSRFKVIHLDKNGGAAHARNIALQHATGEWAMMLDSDDWIGDFDDRLAESLAPPLTPKAPLDPPLRGEGEDYKVTPECGLQEVGSECGLQKVNSECGLQEVSSECELQKVTIHSSPSPLRGGSRGALGVRGGACFLLQCDYEYPDGRTERFPLAKKEWTPQEAALAAINWQGIHGLYIVPTDLYRQIPYDASAILYSDDNTTRLHYLYSNRVIATETSYHYRQHGQSMTHKISERYFDIITAHASLQRDLDSSPLATPEIRQKLLNMRWRELTDSWHYYYVNRRHFTNTDEIERLLRSSYRELIDKKITAPIRLHFGYWRLRPYFIYTLHAKIYFLLRKMMGK